jgi:hypothetical protein
MFLLLLFGLVGAHVGGLQQTAASAPEVRFPLRIVTIDVQPTNPGPETLCRLRVTLRNSGSGTVADVKFEVKVNGHRLVTYLNHAWYVALASGKDLDLQLFNFWSSESGRVFPKDGRLTVEVRIAEAHWEAARPGSVGDAILPLPPATTKVLGLK